MPIRTHQASYVKKDTNPEINKNAKTDYGFSREIHPVEQPAQVPKANWADYCKFLLA